MLIYLTEHLLCSRYWTSKEIKPVNSKGNQPWIFIGRTDAEIETPILWPIDMKSSLTVKDPGAGKDWRQVEKETTEDEMIGWHLQLDEHEFDLALGTGDRQGSLACCSPRGRKSQTQLSNWRTIATGLGAEHNIKVRKKQTQALALRSLWSDEGYRH